MELILCKEDTPEEKPSAVDMLDVNGLTDDELKASLLKHGLNAGPIVASTRALYERRLLKILQSNMPSEPTVNGAGDANAYSDSEEEGDEEGQDEDSDSNDSRQDDILTLELSPENNKQPEQPKWELCTPKNESAYYTPNASYKQTVEEGLTVVPTRLYPSAVPIPPGITATCRRPIKGAAGRPVLYKYPDAPPTSPTTLERREVDARLVPVYAQVLVFLAIACLLYLVYACMEENPYHPLLPLLDGLSEALESQEEGPVGLAHPGDPADTPVDL
ncbi:LEM domain-containing protein 1 isoform X4 [Gadus chalcogrammus]|uniref:LEM domain-containing protein 1 isoform X4 n=1 Tax=Gadus chalcogrammus TaxID=1042646 RepID=UPI0024C33D8F|nr:LEM domain-containing protein 1 isoform X4 [Gadus chalcogrammus]